MIKGVLLDISGVLHNGNEAVPGAVEAVVRLRKAGLAIRFVTNTTRKSKRQVLARLAALSFQIADGELFTPAAAVCEWLEHNGHAPHLLIHPDLEEDFADCSREGPLAVVMGDAGHDFTYDRLNAAFRLLLNGAPLLALARNRTFLDQDGQLSLDMGPFVELLEHASGTQAILFGKPAPDFFQAAVKSMGCGREETAMVGDDAESDVAGALSAGIGTAILVRTGKYREGDEARSTPRPSTVVKGINEAVDYILEMAAGC
jgi:HAD superfamily hydrolase (TIGR01458 family)